MSHRSLLLLALCPSLAFGAVAFPEGPLRSDLAKASQAADGERRYPLEVSVGQLAAAPEIGRMLLPGVDGTPVEASNIRVEERADGLRAWTGSVETDAGRQSAVIVFGTSAAFGLIPQRSGPPLRIETQAGATWLVEGQSTLPVPGSPDFALPPPPDAAGRALRAKQQALKADGIQQVDVVVMYNGELVAVMGSNEAVLTRIAYLETITNQAYVDSNVGLRVRVVAAQLVDYALRNDNSDALSEITDSVSLPIRVEALRLRDQYGADLVKLMRNFDRTTQTSCGVGWIGGYHGAPFTQQYGFSVTSDRGFRNDNCGEWTFAHELGHNMGGHHDTETSEGDYGAYLYSRGYRRTVDQSAGFATVMAYIQAPQVRIGRFSNPRLASCLSLPCGDAAEADNARGFSEAAPAIAAITPAVAQDGRPTVRVDDASITEGNSGRRALRFGIHLSTGAHAGVTLQLATADGSAGRADYIAGSATLLIPAGQSQATFDIDVRGDTIAERDEVFALNILSASNARIVDGQGVGTILNDEPLPVLNVGDVEVTEGDSGAAQATFTATLTQASNTAVTFDAKSTNFAPAPDTATAGTDFEVVFLQGLRIEPGQTSVQFSIPVIGDTEVEQDEIFLLMISNVTGAATDDIFGWGTILDDDGEGGSAPILSIADASVQEGNAGTRDLVLPVTLSAPANGDVGFSLSTQDGTAVAGQDYAVPPATTVVIPAGQVSAEARVSVIGDTLDEADEFFLVRLANITGASAGVITANGRILDDDGSAGTPPLVARDDRFVLREGSGATRLGVIANDVATAARLAGGSLALSTTVPGGTVSIDTAGTPATAADDALVYTPRAGETGDDAFGYRLCEGSGRCTEGLVQVVRRPLTDVAIETRTGEGFADLELSGLPPLPDARIQAMNGSRVATAALDLGQDPTPESPWDLGGAGTDFALNTLLPNSQLGGGFNGQQVDTRRRVLADARSSSGGDIDLYLGIDANRNGRPDPEEVRCTSAMSPDIERCELATTVLANGSVDYWAMLHSRSGAAQLASLERFEFQLESADGGRLTATGPGHLAAGEAFPARVSWLVPDYLPGQPAAAYLSVQAGPDQPRRLVPVRVDRVDPIAGPTPLWSAAYFALPPGAAADRVYVDVPEGATGLTIRTDSTAPLDLYLAKANSPDGGLVPAAPPRVQAQRSWQGLAGLRWLSVPGAELSPGRWYLTPVNPGASFQRPNLSVVVEGAPRLPTPGSYYNPDRGGHGLFVYPAGNQWAGLWYTYLQDGTPTWYYLQNTAPQPGETRWYSPIMRAAWNGSANVLTSVGFASLTATAEGEVLYTYLLDGESGSERMVVFGAGCPTLAGVPVDASSHWFDPARAGTGYSVQLFPDYEFYAAFVYDARGVPRFLTAESPRFAGADAVLPLEQLTGFCPLCERTGAPARAEIGTLRRRFAGGGLAGFELDGLFTGGVPGAWTGNDAVQLLGGPGTTQGCPVQ
ncbi:Calx-beta domain-containing protein [Arenimonas malthae]|uniref:Calx-beta domain-containing protein n=1 Tax=Arenimonas malthae TaxID=354197 RepID=UPI0012EC8E77|nr:Calx-beta domain-containing protein [Arenimonas malthae]